jgi:hypothetical protein
MAREMQTTFLDRSHVPSRLEEIAILARLIAGQLLIVL